MKKIWLYDQNRNALEFGAHSIGINIREYNEMSDPGPQIDLAVADARTKNKDFFVGNEISFVIEEDGNIENEGLFILNEHRIHWIK